MSGYRLSTLVFLLLLPFSFVFAQEQCEEVGNCEVRCDGHLIDYSVDRYDGMPVSRYATRVAKISSLVHGTSVSTFLRIIESGRILSAFDAKKRNGNFGNKEPLKSIFLQAMPNVEELKNFHYTINVDCPSDPAEREKVPQCKGNPDVEGYFETRYFEIVLSFDFKVLDEFPFYANTGWNFDEYRSCISPERGNKIRSLFRLISSFAHNDIRNEITFYLPKIGLSLKKYLKGIFIQPEATSSPEELREARERIAWALQDAGWSDDEITTLFNGQGLQSEF